MSVALQQGLFAAEIKTPASRRSLRPVRIGTDTVGKAIAGTKIIGKSVKAFLQAAIGPGQVDLARNGYIPLSPDFQARVSSAVDAISSVGQQNPE